MADQTRSGAPRGGRRRAGTVLAWDSGTYDNLADEELADGLVRGHLKFWLDGHKVMRGYALTQADGEIVTFDGEQTSFAHRNADGQEYLEQACESGWEGLIAKRADAPYRPGRRTASWLKFKCMHEQELVVGGYTDPAGSRHGFGALLLGYTERHAGGDSGLRYAGKVGTGFDEATLRDLHARFDELAQSRSPFVDQVRERGTHSLRAELVAQIGFTEWTRDGRLRHPRYLGLCHDKEPGDVIREEPS